MPHIRCTSTLFTPDANEKVASGILLSLPQDVSEQLPSRGMVMVNGTMNGSPFQAALEPDGKGSHWFKVGEALFKAANAQIGDTVELTVEPTREWPEPTVPADLQEILAADPEALAIWTDITPAARWDWIRWAGAVRQAETRQKRVGSVPSRLKSGKRRPCCFNRNECTLTEA